MLKWYLAGPLVCAVSLPLLLYVCALLLAREILPFGLMEELVIACVFLSGTLGGLAAALSRGEKAFQTGLSVGGILASVIVVLTLAVPGEGALSASCIRHVIAALAGGASAQCQALGRKKEARQAKIILLSVISGQVDISQDI